MFLTGNGTPQCDSQCVSRLRRCWLEGQTQVKLRYHSVQSVGPLSWDWVRGYCTIRYVISYTSKYRLWPLRVHTYTVIHCATAVNKKQPQPTNDSMANFEVSPEVKILHSSAKAFILHNCNSNGDQPRTASIEADELRCGFLDT